MIGNCPFNLVAFKTDMTLFDSVLNNKNELDIFSINSNSNRLFLFRLSEIDFKISGHIWPQPIVSM